MLGSLAGCLLVCVCTSAAAQQLKGSWMQAVPAPLCSVLLQTSPGDHSLHKRCTAGGAAGSAPSALTCCCKERQWVCGFSWSWAMLEGAKLPSKPSASAWLFVLEAFSNGNSCFLLREQQLLKEPRPCCFPLHCLPLLAFVSFELNSSSKLLVACS